MKKIYGFSKAKRGAVIPTTGKTPITIYIDDATLKRFKTDSGSLNPERTRNCALLILMF
jgi:hypothetical protein